MNKFINETLVIYISKFTNTKVIKALKDGMMFSLPFLMIGSLFLLIANLPIESVSKVISESGIGDVCSQVYSSTFSLMAFFTVIGITYSYLKNDQVITAINGALTGLAAFILLTPSSKVLDSGESVTGIISKDWTAGQGMICAILIGFLVGYIYSLWQEYSIKELTEIAAFCREKNIQAATVYYKYWSEDVQKIFDKKGIRLYIYTVNDLKEAQYYMQEGAAGVCSDYLQDTMFN